MKYYVVGIEDTRGEFDPRGVTKSKQKAEKFKIKLTSERFSNCRSWVSIRAVDNIK